MFACVCSSYSPTSQMTGILSSGVTACRALDRAFLLGRQLYTFLQWSLCGVVHRLRGLAVFDQRSWVKVPSRGENLMHQPLTERSSLCKRAERS